MSDNPNQPREYDAVLGGQTPPPVQGVILGGIEGVKYRLSSSNIEARISALGEALNYGEAGLNLVTHALDDKFRRVRHAAISLLQERNEAQVKLILQNYKLWSGKFWSGFVRLDQHPDGYFNTFSNREVIEFDPETSITDPVGAAYALRGKNEWKKYNDKPDNEPDMELVDKLHMLVQDPLASQVEALVFGFWSRYSDISCHVVDALIDVHEQLPNLKDLFIGHVEDYDFMLCEVARIDLSLLFVAYPQLEVFKICGGTGLSFAPLQHEKLKALIVESRGLHPQVINQICTLELPALEYLERIRSEGVRKPVIFGVEDSALR